VQQGAAVQHYKTYIIVLGAMIKPRYNEGLLYLHSCSLLFKRVQVSISATFINTENLNKTDFCHWE
jgi:hypothetical protein